MPLLVRGFADDGVVIEDVRIPPGNRQIDLGMAAKLIRSAWFERAEQERPDKFVVLVDTDRASPENVLAPLSELPARLDDIGAHICFAYAQPHLEAWFFADAKGMREYLGRDLGSVDASQPDAMQNPKGHLRNLLGSRLYTSRLAGEVASKLDGTAIAGASPSFSGFVAALRNGGTGG